MLTQLYRITRYGLQSFWRQRLLSMATVVVVLLALMVVQGLFIVGAVGDAALDFIKSRVDVAVSFEPGVSEDEVLSIKADIEQLEEVEVVEYISSEQVLQDLLERNKDNEDVIAAIDALDTNPLGPELGIETEEIEQIPVVAAYLNNVVDESLVDQITYNDESKEAIDTLAFGIRAIELAGLIIILFLTGVAVLVSFNTIMIGIYSNRDEITIMRLVGAANFFVRGPFIILGVLYGIVTASIVMLVSIPIVHFVSPSVSALVPTMNLVDYFWGNFVWLYLAQVGLGVAIGVISSIIAINRYLKI